MESTLGTTVKNIEQYDLNFVAQREKSSLPPNIWNITKPLGMLSCTDTALYMCLSYVFGV